METEKVLTYAAMIVAGLVALIFILDATLAVLGRNIVLDILFILGAAFVIWQGFETSREFR
jgi:dolichyl-phosphate-mannose--protein O-mannosyl transferase